MHVDVGRNATLEALHHAVDFGDAGHEHQHVAVVVAQSACNDVHDRIVEALLLAHRSPSNIDGELATIAGDHRRVIAEHTKKAFGVGGGRHREHAQIGSQQTSGVECERHAQIGGQISLVHFVEDHERGAGQTRIALQATSEDALGHHFDARVRSDASLVARLVTHQSAGFLTDERRQTTGRGTSRQSTRLQHHDATTADPWLFDQAQGNERGLSGTGRRDQHRAPMIGECGS